MTLRIAPMTRNQLGIALAWAAEEGWNPGLDDADAFHAADPGGFLMGWIDDTPVSCISVVRHDPGFAFLGLYLCRPDWRGRGHGWAVWQAGLAIAGDRTIGLDGVVDQQANYRRSGFVSDGRTLRFAGDVAAGSSEGLRPASAMHKRVAALDRDATGIGRPAFLGAWLSDTPTRRSLCIAEGDDFAAFGTIRRCLSGAKVGPLFAREPADARRLLAALAGVFPDRPLILDVPETNAAAQAMVAGLGMEPMFETARMYRGTPPAQDPAVTWGVATLELG